MIVDSVMDIRAKRTKYQFENDPATKVSSLGIPLETSVLESLFF